MIRHEEIDKKFVKYLMEFYGRGGLYAKFFRPGGMKHGTAVYVTNILLHAAQDGEYEWGGGDSVDRELARDIAFLMRDPNMTVEHPKAEHLFLKYAHKRWKSK